jgi:hypothetical protein
MVMIDDHGDNDDSNDDDDDDDNDDDLWVHLCVDD